MVNIHNIKRLLQLNHNSKTDRHFLHNINNKQKHIKRCSTSVITKEMQIMSGRNRNLHVLSVEWTIVKLLWKTEWWFLRIKTATTGLSNCTCGSTFKRQWGLNAVPHTYVHSRIVYNYPKVEGTQVPTEEWTDEKETEYKPMIEHCSFQTGNSDACDKMGELWKHMLS